MLGLDVDSDEWRQGSDVNNPVEPHEELLDCELGIDDHLFSRLEGFENRASILILFGTHWRNIRLDASSAQADRNHGSNKSPKACATLYC